MGKLLLTAGVVLYKDTEELANKASLIIGITLVLRSIHRSFAMVEHAISFKVSHWMRCVSRSLGLEPKPMMAASLGYFLGGQRGKQARHRPFITALYLNLNRTEIPSKLSPQLELECPKSG